MEVLKNRKRFLPPLPQMVNMQDALGSDPAGTQSMQPPAEPPTQPGVAPENTGGFQYQHEDTYQRLLRQASGQAAYRYNPQTDPAMRIYERAYRREGDRATANALAQAAAATGGVPSSYAVGAAQQAGAYYASKMADKAAELEQQAYQRYLNERAATLQGLNALSADREDAYSKYLKQQAMQQQAEQAAGQSLYSTGVSADTVQWVKDMTNGAMTITDPYTWEELLQENTEEELRAAGITYAGA